MNAVRANDVPTGYGSAGRASACRESFDGHRARRVAARARRDLAPDVNTPVTRQTEIYLDEVAGKTPIIPIVPRVLRDVTTRGLAVELFGRQLPAPLLLAPIGVLELVHREADLAVARAAAHLGVPMIFSNRGGRRRVSLPY